MKRGAEAARGPGCLASPGSADVGSVGSISPFVSEVGNPRRGGDGFAKPPDARPSFPRLIITLGPLSSDPMPWSATCQVSLEAASLVGCTRSALVDAPPAHMRTIDVTSA